MAITQAQLDLVRNELDAKISSVTVEHVSMAQAIGSYGERFTAIEARLDTYADAIDLRLDHLSQDLDRRFDAVDRRFELMDRRFEEIDRRFEEIDRRFDAVDDKSDAIETRLTRLETKVEKLDDKIDNRFGWQAVMMTALGALVLFDDAVRAAFGL